MRILDKDAEQKMVGGNAVQGVFAAEAKRHPRQPEMLIDYLNTEEKRSDDEQR